MFIKEYKRNAFERQIQEAVNIQHESNNQAILNSKAEWNQSCLPRLVTRIGESDPETEIRELEKVLKEKQDKENVIEEKIRNLRKTRNKARLTTDRNVATKRRKTNEENYISIRKTWGQPTPTAPKKK